MAQNNYFGFTHGGTQYGYEIACTDFIAKYLVLSRARIRGRGRARSRFALKTGRVSDDGTRRPRGSAGSAAITLAARD